MQNSQQIFKLHSEYKPTGDQPQAIEKLVVFCGMWVVEHPDVVEGLQRTAGGRQSVTL